MSDTQIHEDQNIYKVKMHRWRMAFFSLVILLAGIVIGAASSLLVVWRLPRGPGQGPENSVGRMMNGLQHELHLSPEQRRQVDPIVHKHMEKLDQIRKSARPMIEKELRQMNDEISPILDDQQRAMWHQMQQRLAIEPPGGQMQPMPFGQPPRQFPRPESPQQIPPQPPQRPENPPPMPPPAQ